MSQDEIARLLAEEAALKEKLRQLTEMRATLQEEERKRREEEERQERLKKPVTLIVSALSGGSLLLVGPYREDVVEVFKSTPGRVYRGAGGDGGKNLIPISEWERCEGRLLQRPLVTIEWKEGVKEELEWYVSAPPWEVDVHPNRRGFIARPGPQMELTRIFTHIPGGEWDWSKRLWTIPLAEGWRIFEALKGIEGVVYTDDAREMIFAQVERRSKLDSIAQQEDSDFMTHLNGNELRRFQRVGVEYIYNTGGRCLLADGTGLGKTWQGLAYAEKMRSEHQDWQTLVVAKAANIPNWRREVKRLTGEDILICKSGTPDFFTIQEVTTKRVPYALISYDTLGIKKEVETEEDCPRLDSHQEGEYCWDCEGKGTVKKKQTVFPWASIFKIANPDLLILDEAHQIKNPDANRTKATRTLNGVPHIIPMTASPVLNRTMELWTILNMLDPQMFKSYQSFINNYTWNGTSPRNVDRLHELLRPMFLRRKKSDVLKDLPPINRIYHYHELSPRAEHLYQKVLKGIYEQLATYDPWGIGGQEMSVVSMLAQITRLKQICAADKTDFTAEMATDLIDQANGTSGKVLLFSQFKGTANTIAAKLGHEAVCTVKRTPNGFVSLTAEQRDELFESARGNDDIKYVVTTEAAKEGHNLEFCDWVIFNDLFWTPAGHDQCEGRAYGRLSNPHAIDSIYVVADKQIERWIMQLLQKKLAIIDAAVEAVETSRDASQSIAKDLIRKMKEEMWRRDA